MRDHPRLTLIEDDPARRGLTLRDVLWGLTLVLMIVVVGQVARSGWGSRAKMGELRQSVVELRRAVASYQADHGFYPGASGDFNHRGDPAVFARQLSQYTDARGEPSPVRDEAHHFGPYLKSIPAEPVSGSREVRIDTRSDRLLPELSRAVAQGPGQGGWYYEARSGQVLANLGQTFPAVYARF
jgi:hypothetical protein